MASSSWLTQWENFALKHLSEFTANSIYIRTENRNTEMTFDISSFIQYYWRLDGATQHHVGTQISTVSRVPDHEFANESVVFGKHMSSFQAAPNRASECA